MTLARLATWAVFDARGLAGREALPALVLGLRYDARVVGVMLLGLFALGLTPWLDPFRGPGRKRFWFTVLGVAFAALLVVYVADFLHLRYLSQRLNATALGFLADASISTSMVWQSYPVIRILLGMAAVLGAGLFAFRRLFYWAEGGREAKGRLGRVGWAVAVFAGCLLMIWGRPGQYPLRWSDAFGLAEPNAARLALNPIESFTSSLSFRSMGYDLAQVDAHYATMAAYLGVEASDPRARDFTRAVVAPAPVGPPPNIVLVLCESFSAYKSSMWGNALDTTPFFASLAEEGQFYDNCYTPHFGTARGVWALVTGLPDVLPLRTASRNPAMVDQHTIIDDFEGYEKLYFLGGSASWANIRGVLTHNIRGLRLYEEDRYTSPRVDVWGISDKNLLLEADRELRRQTKPFFAIIQTAANHRPYTIPEEDRDEFEVVDLPLATVQAHGFESLAEFNAFRYSDFAYRKFMAAAREAPYFDNTIFVFIGDHGIGGDAGAMLPAAWTRQNLTRYHVPLLFYAPRLLEPQRVSSVASMVDVLPTLAGMAGISYRNTTLGRDLRERERIDGGAGNTAFIIDHNDRTIGVRRGSYYGLQGLDGTNPERVWADFTRPEQTATEPSPAPAELTTLATAFYETTRYLLLHNAKPRPAPPTELASTP